MTQIVLQLPEFYTRKLEVEANFRKKKLEEIITELIQRFIREKEDEEAYDVTSDPLYNMGCYDSDNDEPKENYSSNIDSYLYHNGNYPK